jgi:hypothetical protein
MGMKKPTLTTVYENGVRVGRAQALKDVLLCAGEWYMQYELGAWIFKELQKALPPVERKALGKMLPSRGLGKKLKGMKVLWKAPEQGE